MLLWPMHSPLGKLVGQLIQHSVEGPLQLIEDGGHVLLQLFTTHLLIHFLQLYTKLLYVVHEDASLGEKHTSLSIVIAIIGDGTG